MKRRIISFLLFLFCFEGFAQDKNTFFTGFFPEVSFTKSLPNSNKLNFKVENQHVIFDNRLTERPQFDHYRTDFMLFHDWKLNATQSMALGVFHRIQDGANGNRLVQQFAFLNRLRGLRIAHRMRTDQTFTRGESVEVRFRYRLASEFPLNGSTLDPGEGYLLISNEPIFSLQGGEFNLENRLVLSYGKLYAKNQKLEYAIDYRTDGFFNNNFRTRLWPKISYFYNF